jgi:hypothetical protein
VQVRCTEGIASHSGTESCVDMRERIGEALTGEYMGQPLSRVKPSFRVPTHWTLWKATRGGALLRAPARPGAVEDPGACRRSLYGNRESWDLAGGVLPVRAGKARSQSR